MEFLTGIVLIFARGRNVGSLLRFYRELALYCSTARIGSLPQLTTRDFPCMIYNRPVLDTGVLNTTQQMFTDKLMCVPAIFKDKRP